MLMQSKIYAQCEQLGHRIKEGKYFIFFFFFCRLNREIFGTIVYATHCQHIFVLIHSADGCNDCQANVPNDRQFDEIFEIFQMCHHSPRNKSNRIFGTFLSNGIHLFTLLLDKAYKHTHITWCINQCITN